MRVTLSRLLTPSQHAAAIAWTLLAANIASLVGLVQTWMGRSPLLAFAALVVCLIVGVTLMTMDTKAVPGADLGGE